MSATGKNLSTDSVAAAAVPPLGLLPELHRAREKGVPNAHHEEVGGIYHLPRAVPAPPEQDLAADANRRHR